MPDFSMRVCVVVFLTCKCNVLSPSDRSYANYSLSFKAIGLKLSQGLISFACSIYVSRNQPDRSTISYSSHRNNRKKYVKQRRTSTSTTRYPLLS